MSCTFSSKQKTSSERMPESNTALGDAEKDGSKDVGNETWKTLLTPTQYAILRDKGTDTAFKGIYDNFFEEGAYHCAACGTLLYTSTMKYECGCGWPGFWDCVPKSVREEVGGKGRHVEIVCNACNGHLGHVFRRATGNTNPLNERHCVNSTSLKFVPKDGIAEEAV